MEITPGKCKDCGQEPTIHSFDNGYGKRYYVACSGYADKSCRICGCGSSVSTETEAIKSWNSYYGKEQKQC